MTVTNITSRNKIKHHDSKFVHHGALWYKLGMAKILNDSSAQAINLRIKFLAAEVLGTTSPGIISKLAGVRQGTVSNWLTTRTHQRPGIDNLSRLSGIFRVSINFLLQGVKHGESDISNELLQRLLERESAEMASTPPPKPSNGRKAKKSR